MFTIVTVIFLISCGTTKPKVKKEITAEDITKEKFGLVVSNLSDSIKTATGLSHGIFVVNVFANYPAQKAGIKKGDIITKFRKEHVLNLESFNQKAKNGLYNYDQIDVTFFRDQKSETVIMYMY